MAGQFDPNDMAQNIEQQAKDKADSAIDDAASKVPGGDQVAQQAKDAANQGIDQAGQQAQQQAGDKLGGMFGGGQDAGGQGSNS